MKFNHILLVITLATAHNIIFAVAPLEDEAIEEAQTGFSHLPAAVQVLIFKNIAKEGTAKEAIQKIRRFFIANKQLAQVASDPYLNAPIIYELAKNFYKGDLIQAAINLNTPGSKAWLAQQQDLRDPKLARTSLMVAANENKVSLMQQLLQGGQKINAKDKQGNTALHYAARRGNLEAVKLLLESGADMELANNAGFTPLLLSIRRNHPEIAKFLIARGANVNIRDAYGTTTLLEAAAIDSPELVQLLLAHHVDPNLADQTGHTALIIVTRPLLKPEHMNAATKIIDMLIKAGALVNIACQDGETPLKNAAMAGNAQAVQLLLDRNAEVNPPAGTYSPLMAAIMSNNLPIVKKLLFKGADVNATDEEGHNVLSYAVGAPNGADIIRELLKKNLLDVNTPEGTYTPLILAAQKGYVDVVQGLLARGAHVNAQVQQGYSALTAAIQAEKPNLELIQALLKAGANPNIVFDSNGYTPLIWPESGKHPEIVRALIEAGADVNAKIGGYTALYSAILSRHLGTVREILKAPHLNPNIENDHKVTALSSAIIASHDVLAANAEFVKALPEIIQALVKKGADVNHKVGETGNTPLMQAVLAARPDIIKILLAAGADKNARNIDGYTALELAELSGYKEVESLLK